MLVLSRRPGEQICIGNNVFVKLVSIRGTHVRIGIEAPVEAPVDRQELRERKAFAASPRSGPDVSSKVKVARSDIRRSGANK